MKLQNKDVALTQNERIILEKMKEALSLGIDVDKLIEGVKSHKAQ